MDDGWMEAREMVEQITLITHEHLDRSLQFILKQMEKLHID